MIYNGQSLLTIKLNTGMDVSAATVKRILYKKPDGTTGYWTASSVEALKTLVYDVAAGNIDAGGQWYLQAYVEIASRKGYGLKVGLAVEAPIAQQ